MFKQMGDELVYADVSGYMTSKVARDTLCEALRVPEGEAFIIASAHSKKVIWEGAKRYRDGTIACSSAAGG